MSDNETSVFISYKVNAATGLSFQAQAIAEKLEQSVDPKCDVWLDRSDIEAGVDWNKQIYERIPVSDILILLLSHETTESDWVRREIDVAKGAQVTILPVLIRGDFDLQDALDHFDIPRVQVVKMFDGSQQEYEALFDAIRQRAGETRVNQQDLLRRVGELSESERHEPVRDYRVFAGPNNGATQIVLAAGDMVSHRDIEVLVNTENDYFQMARVFDAGGPTISAQLRHHGSQFDSAGRLQEDTVQNELNEKAKDVFDLRPVGLGTSVPTAAGHPEGNLARHNHARYIFHTATVAMQIQVEGGQADVRPVESSFTVKQAVRRTLDLVQEVNNRSGVISPENSLNQSSQKAEQGSYAALRSIIFPIFGTGEGGRPPDFVAPFMAQAFKEYLIDTPDTSLRKIYLSALTREDVRVVEEVLTSNFGSPLDTTPE